MTGNGAKLCEEIIGQSANEEITEHDVRLLAKLIIETLAHMYVQKGCQRTDCKPVFYNRNIVLHNVYCTQIAHRRIYCVQQGSQSKGKKGQFS